MSVIKPDEEYDDISVESEEKNDIDDDDVDFDEEEEDDEEPKIEDYEEEHHMGIDEAIEKVGIDMNDDDDDDDDEEDFEKFDKDIKEELIETYHPELKTLNYEEIEALCIVVRGENGIIVDPLHKTLPILSRYERARILGERADQINSGAQPFIEIDDSMIDGYLIAMKELEEKKIPFIVQRPLPNGGCEYWRIKDLEIL